MQSSAPRFFRTPADLRRWLEAYGARRTELIVGFPKKGSGLKGITYLEALDEALCFGWIDSVLVPVDARRYGCRFTPRRPRSIWSPANVKRVGELRRAGRMAPAGLATFAKRDPASSAIYAEARRIVTLSPAYLKRLGAKPKARAFFEAQPPGYRRTAAFWVMSAKKEETRERRFATLVADSAAGRRIAPLAPRPERSGR